MKLDSHITAKKLEDKLAGLKVALFIKVNFFNKKKNRPFLPESEYIKSRLGQKLFTEWSSQNLDSIQKQSFQTEAESQEISEVVLDQGKDLDKLVMRRNILEEMGKDLQVFDKRDQTQDFFENYYDPLEFDL